MLKVDALSLGAFTGGTPLFPLRRRRGATVLVKLEGQNLGGSVKDRAAWGMLRRAEARGDLREETVVVEPTSGNTGIALALWGRALGLRVILTMPESMSVERRAVLAAYGAELELTPAASGMKGAIARAGELTSELPGGWMPDQFSNPGNPWAHRVTTGPEIVADLKGRNLAAFVAGVGTGGTLSGAGSLLKAAYPETQIVAVEPAESPVLSGGAPGPHAIQGIGAGFVPANLDRSLLTRVLAVSGEEALETARSLAREEGLFAGISSGANIAAARKIAESFGDDDVVVTIACDRGDKYLSTEAFRLPR